MIRVAVVDDHPLVRRGVINVLSDSPDIDVVGEEGTGAGALSLVRRTHPDVLVLDLSMPFETGIPSGRTSATGIDVLSTVRKELAENAPRVVVLSVHGEPDIVRAALAAGASGYVLKESVSSDLLEAVRAARSGALYLSAGLASILTLKPSPVPSAARLSPRELEVVGLIVDGHSTREIAGLLFTSPKTVEKQRRDAMRKLGVTNIAMLVRAHLGTYGGTLSSTHSSSSMSGPQASSQDDTNGSTQGSPLRSARGDSQGPMAWGER